MNILPKKSWHVRTKKNIERVLRDEAEADRATRLEQNRVLKAEQEARNRELRARAGIAEPAPGHLNLFEDVAGQSAVSNEEKTNETKSSSSTAIINRLGRTSDVNKPWYCGGDDLNSLTRVCRREQPTDNAASTTQITSIYDPMIAIMDAERIVKAKRAQQRQVETNRNQEYTGNRSSLALKGHKSATSKTKVIVQSDSSPEIVKIVDKHTTRKHKRSKKDTCRKSKKHKRDHSSRKRHKKHKKHRH